MTVYGELDLDSVMMPCGDQLNNDEGDAVFTLADGDIIKCACICLTMVNVALEEYS